MEIRELVEMIDARAAALLKEKRYALLAAELMDSIFLTVGSFCHVRTS
jgi:hypothetical protein